MKNASTYSETRTNAMTRPRFSLLQGIVAVAAVVAVTACIAGGHQTRQTSELKTPSQAPNVTATDLSNMGAVDWIIQPLRSACAEWDDESGRYAWIASGLKTQGVTQDAILAFCDGFQSACSSS